MSRRHFLRAGALAIGLPAMAACVATPAAQPSESGESAESAPAGDQIQLVMANYGAIPDGWIDLGKMFEEENPNIKVTFEGVQATTWGDYFDKLVVQFAAGTPPDLARVAIEGTQLVAHRGVAIPLDDYIERDAEELAEYFEDVAPNMLASMSYLGKQYQLPFTWNGPVIHYNKRMFEAAGIERPADDWTLEDFLEISLKLTDPDNDVYAFGMGVAYWGGIIPWIFVAGSDLLNEDWTESIANSPETIEAIQLAQDMIWKHRITPQVGPDGNQMRAMFGADQLAMLGIGGGNLRLALVNDGMEDFDILYYPRWRTQTHEYGGTGFPIMSTSPNPDAAWQLNKFLVRRESIIAFVNSVAQTPARKSVAYNDWIQAGSPPEHFQIYWDMLNDARSVPAPPEYNEIESIFLRYYGLVLANEQSAEAAMNAAHDEINAVLAQRQPPVNA